MLLEWLKLQWDRAAAWLFLGLGLLALLIGWVGASGTPHLAYQIPYMISGGIGGIVLVGIGAMLWISADLRDEWCKLDDLHRAIVERDLLLLAAEEPVALEPAPVQRRSRSRSAAR